MGGGGGSGGGTDQAICPACNTVLFFLAKKIFWSRKGFVTQWVGGGVGEGSWFILSHYTSIRTFSKSHGSLPVATKIEMPSAKNPELSQVGE